MTQPHAPRAALPATPLAIAAGSLVAVLWAYWSTLAEMAQRWLNDPQYMHGLFVPVFAGYLLYLRRDQVADKALSQSAWGVVLIVLGAGLRLAGTYFHFGYFDQVSLLPCLAGLALLAGGWPALRWSWPAVGFLVFMIPLPHTVSVALTAPLRTFATNASTFVLQTLGRPAVAEGNLIYLSDLPQPLDVADACSGLSMMLTFFALSTGVALLVNKPLWEKALIVASAVPIALVSNVLRITGTGIAHEIMGADWHAFFHDYVFGYGMPLIGSALLLLELWVLERLFIEPPAGRPLPSQLALERADASAVSLYRGGSSSRRERRSAKPAAEPKPEPTPEPAPAESAAPPA